MRGRAFVNIWRTIQVRRIEPSVTAAQELVYSRIHLSGVPSAALPSPDLVCSNPALVYCRPSRDNRDLVDTRSLALADY